MRTAALVFGLIGSGLSVVADQVVPPRISSAGPQPRIEKLLRNQVRYLLHNLPDESDASVYPLTDPAFDFAVCLKFADCQEPAETRAAFTRLIRSVTHMHLTGGGRTASGSPWGHQWQSAYWAAKAGFGAWLMWSELEPDLRNAVAAMVADEADFFSTVPPPYGEFNDTKAEENAWNSMILALASAMMPGHPHQAKWHERALEYMISAYATRADRTSDRLVDGRRLRDWVKGANIHSDFTLENHGIAHPDYMTCIILNLANALPYRLAGRPVPQAVMHNARPVYDQLKFFSMPDGTLFYPNGTDWSLHRASMTWSLHVAMERLAQDRQAGALAETALAALERMQARKLGGIYAPGEFESYRGIEADTGWEISMGLMFAKFWPAPVQPKPIGNVWKELEGARLFDDGRFFVVRTVKSISSFAWGSRIMGLTLPFTLDSIVNPINHSYVGLATEWNAEPIQPARVGVGSLGLFRAIGGERVTVSTTTLASELRAMSVTGLANHSGRRHSFSFTALPTGASIYMERFAGEGEPVHGGLISVREEAIAVYGNGHRKIQHGDRDWLNVDDRLGFAISGTGRIRVIPDARSQTVILNDSPKRDSIAVIVTLPTATAAETRDFASRPFRLNVKHAEVAAVAVDGFIVATNFGGDPVAANADHGGRGLSFSISGVSTRVFREDRPSNLR